MLIRIAGSCASKHMVPTAVKKDFFVGNCVLLKCREIFRSKSGFKNNHRNESSYISYLSPFSRD